MINKIITIAIGLVMICTFIQCTKKSDSEIDNSEKRTIIISQLMDNETYMNEVMVAMKVKHGDAINSTHSDMMKEDKTMGMKMMGNMMVMCKTDTTMCKMMMDKTMEMCDMDKEKCKMMLSSMQAHPKGMMDMKDMGMCNMKGMDMKK